MGSLHRQLRTSSNPLASFDCEAFCLLPSDSGGDVCWDAHYGPFEWTPLFWKPGRCFGWVLFSVPPAGPVLCVTHRSCQGQRPAFAGAAWWGCGRAAVAGSRAGTHQALGRRQCPGQELADPAARGSRQQGGEVCGDPHPPAEQRQCLGPWRAHGTAPRRPQRPHRGERRQSSASLDSSLVLVRLNSSIQSRPAVAGSRLSPLSLTPRVAVTWLHPKLWDGFPTCRNTAVAGRCLSRARVWVRCACTPGEMAVPLLPAALGSPCSFGAGLPVKIRVAE